MSDYSPLIKIWSNLTSPHNLSHVSWHVLDLCSHLLLYNPTSFGLTGKNKARDQSLCTNSASSSKPSLKDEIKIDANALCWLM